jgi:hypothetical protein
MCSRNIIHLAIPLLLAAFAATSPAQCPVKPPPGVTETYPGTAGSQFPAGPLDYPMTSNRYAVEYRVGGGAWTPASVYISYYGGTTSTPYLSDSKYPPDTSLSFVNIPALASATVQIRVTNLFGSPFQPSDHVSVRPSVKLIPAETLLDGTVLISTITRQDFAGEQFILWWDRGAEGGAIESLAFFLNPPYQPPAGALRVFTWTDLSSANLANYEALDFEGPVALGGTGTEAYPVPDNIDSIFLGEHAWVQGKLQFGSDGTTVQKKKIYGPGVLDVSRFRYDRRVCNNASPYPDEGLNAISKSSGGSGLLDNAPLSEFLLDGIVIIDHNHAATNTLVNSQVNNIKTLGWNAVNGGLRIGNNTIVSNEFIRSGDDSLMVWGSNITITNATVWQDYNGGVVNVGWSNNSKGENCLIDGLYVVKTDWHSPANPSWNIPDETNVLEGQNNAVFASLMTPSTQFGATQTSLFRNIFIEDPPQVLFSLRIEPPDCGLIGLGACPSVDLTQKSTLNLNIENLFSPASVVANSIGFVTLLGGYTNTTVFPNETFPSDYTLTGSMNIGFTNVFLEMPTGMWLPLTGADAAGPVAKIGTHGDNVKITYRFRFP